MYYRNDPSKYSLNSSTFCDSLSTKTSTNHLWVVQEHVRNIVLYNTNKQYDLHVIAPEYFCHFLGKLFAIPARKENPQPMLAP